MGIDLALGLFRMVHGPSKKRTCRVFTDDYEDPENDPGEEHIVGTDNEGKALTAFIRATPETLGMKWRKEAMRGRSKWEDVPAAEQTAFTTRIARFALTDVGSSFYVRPADSGAVAAWKKLLGPDTEIEIGVKFYGLRGHVNDEGVKDRLFRNQRLMAKIVTISMEMGKQGIDLEEKLRGN